MLRRVRPVSAPGRREQEPREFYERVCVAYRELAKRETARMHLIDGSGSADEIERKIWQVLMTKFPTSFASATP